jgi:hypothetical protein
MAYPPAPSLLALASLVPDEHFIDLNRLAFAT